MSSKSIHYIESKSIEPNKCASKNDIPIKAIGVFELNFEDFAETEIICFSFPNHIDKRTEEVNVSYSELIERINRNHSYPSKLLILWLMPDGHLYNVTSIGAEGEWWFIAGNMGEGTPIDFTRFLKKHN